MVRPWYLKGLENSMYWARSLFMVSGATIISARPPRSSPIMPFHSFLLLLFTWSPNRMKATMRIGELSCRPQDVSRQEIGLTSAYDSFIPFEMALSCYFRNVQHYEHMHWMQDVNMSRDKSWWRLLLRILVYLMLRYVITWKNRFWLFWINSCN